MGADDIEQLLARVGATEARLDALEARLGPAAAPAAAPGHAERTIASAQTATTEPAVPAWFVALTDGGRPVDRTPAPASVARAVPAGRTPAPASVARAVPTSVAPASTAPSAAPQWGTGAPRATTQGPDDSRQGDLRTTLAAVEERFAGRALAWFGGAAIVLGAVFLLSLAFSRGWIGPEGRVILALLGGTAALALGAYVLERGDRQIGHVLAPVGLAVITLGFVGATRLYGLVPAEIGLGGAFVSAVIAVLLAVRHDSQPIAGFGLVTILGAPPLLGAGADLGTLAFVGVALAGTTAIALVRTWAWLPSIAFVLTAPQVAVWISGHPAPPIALAGLAVFWALHALAAGGEEYHRNRNDLNARAAALLLGAAAFAVWAGFTILAGELAAWRGLYLIVLTGAHLAIAGWFLGRYGETHLFGLLSAATGVAALTMAIPIQLNGPVIPVAWTAEAAGLAWVAARRGHVPTLAASGALFLLAAARLVAADLLRNPWFRTGTDPAGAAGSALALAFFLGGLAVAVAVLPRRRLRVWPVALGVGVSICAVGLALPGDLAVGGWCAVAVAGTAVWRLLPLRGERPVTWIGGDLLRAAATPADLRTLAAHAIPLSVTAAGALAVAHVATVELALIRLERITLPRVPFADGGTVAAGLLVATALVLAAIVGDRRAQRAGGAAALAVAAWLLPYEIPAWGVVAGWCLIAGGAALVAVRDRPAAAAWTRGGAALLAAAGLVTLISVATPARLFVGASVVDPHPFLVSEATAALGMLALALLAFARLHRAERWAAAAVGAAGLTVLFLLSVAVVDLFADRVGGSIALEELQKQGQVALSILWAIVGLGSFLGGIRSGRILLRQAGLGLLAVTTLKVFLFDLSSLDVAYRVISFLVLGVILLAGAWAFGHLSPSRTEPAADHRGA